MITPTGYRVEQVVSVCHGVGEDITLTVAVPIDHAPLQFGTEHGLIDGESTNHWGEWAAWYPAAWVWHDNARIWLPVEQWATLQATCRPVAPLGLRMQRLDTMAGPFMTALPIDCPVPACKEWGLVEWREWGKANPPAIVWYREKWVKAANWADMFWGML